MPEERKNYIDNKTFSKSLGEWADAKRAAKKNGEPVPPLPEDVGKGALLIAERMARKHNYASYTWREELVSTAVLAVVQYAGSFNSQKTTNGFAYITQIVSNAFKRYIMNEKKQAYLVAKIALETHNYEHLEESHVEAIEGYEAYREKKREQYRERLGASEPKPKKVKAAPTRRGRPRKIPSINPATELFQAA